MLEMIKARRIARTIEKDEKVNEEATEQIRAIFELTAWTKLRAELLIKL